MPSLSRFVVIAMLLPILGAVPPVTCAQVLFSDDFQRSGPQYVYFEPGGWHPVDGVLRSVPRYEWMPGEPGWLALRDPAWHSYQVDLDFRFPTESGVFVFASHVQEDPTAAEGVGSGFMTILRPSPGNFNMQALDPCSGRTLDGLHSAPYRTGWNHLSAQVTPTTVEVTLNEVICVRLESCLSSPATFAIGSGAQIGTFGSSVVEVDNLVVQAFQPTLAQPETWGRVKAERR